MPTFNFNTDLQQNIFDLNTDMNSIGNAVVSKRRKFQEDFKNSNMNIYVDPTGNGSHNQRVAWESAKFAVVKDDGLGNALKVSLWMRHPLIQNDNEENGTLASFELIMGGLVETVLTVVLTTNGFKARHDKGNFTKEFNSLATDLGHEIVDRKIVGDSPRLQELISEFQEELLRIKTFPISDSVVKKAESDKKVMIPFICSAECEENKLRKWKVDSEQAIKLTQFAVCASFDEEIKPIDPSVVILRKKKATKVEKQLEEILN